MNYKVKQKTAINGVWHEVGDTVTLSKASAQYYVQQNKIELIKTVKKSVKKTGE